jgi:hypothetical protein
MTAFVFLGPSLPLDEARRHLDAVFLPPVEQGDVLRVLKREPAAIGIVDGYFEVVPSVWHKEIMVALQAGVPVFGAASMGALRAAELDRFGMVGVGQVYRWFRDGVLEDDDEVAVLHAPADMDFQPLSTAMVDIRDAISAAAKAGIVSEAECAQVLNTAKRLNFRDRSLKTVVEGALAEGMPLSTIHCLEKFLETFGPGLKRRDAIELLRCIAGSAAAPRRPAAALDMERTVFLQALEDEIALNAAHQDAADVAPHQQRPAGRLSGAALTRILARREAARLGIVVERAELTDMAGLLISQLHGSSDVESLAEAAGLKDLVFWRYVEDLCLMKKLQHVLRHAISEMLPQQLEIDQLEQKIRAKNLQK